MTETRKCGPGDGIGGDESVVRISGRFGAHVDSICIHTNKRVSPLLGGEDGAGAYSYEALLGAEIVGFCSLTW
jgi:hypothetical protein